LRRSTNLSKNRKSTEPAISLRKELDSSNRADADESSGGLYQEINEMGVALKNLNLSQVEPPAAPTSSKSSGSKRTVCHTAHLIAA
jgi:hypothetical protein